MATKKAQLEMLADAANTLMATRFAIMSAEARTAFVDNQDERDKLADDLLGDLARLLEAIDDVTTLDHDLLNEVTTEVF